MKSAKFQSITNTNQTGGLMSNNYTRRRRRSLYPRFTTELSVTLDLKFTDKDKLRGTINYYDWYERLEFSFMCYHPIALKYLEGIVIFDNEWQEKDINYYCQSFDRFLIEVLNNTVESQLLKPIQNMKGTDQLIFLKNKYCPIPTKRIRLSRFLTLFDKCYLRKNVPVAEAYHFTLNLLENVFCNLPSRDIAGLFRAKYINNYNIIDKTISNANITLGDPLYEPNTRILVFPRDMVSKGGRNNFQEWRFSFEKILYKIDIKAYEYINDIKFIPNGWSERQKDRYFTKINRSIWRALRETVSHDILASMNHLSGYAIYKQLLRYYDKLLTKSERYNLLDSLLNDVELMDDKNLENFTFVLRNYIFKDYNAEEISVMLCIRSINNPELAVKMIYGTQSLRLDTLKRLINTDLLKKYNSHNQYKNTSDYYSVDHFKY
ncbi:hypothetical protein B5S31_g704 [[Candida] boidinii]|nr:hypothetical protein B5S31_g704 [[Candida] boidinii]